MDIWTRKSLPIHDVSKELCKMLESANSSEESKGAECAQVNHLPTIYVIASTGSQPSLNFSSSHKDCNGGYTWDRQLESWLVWLSSTWLDWWQVLDSSFDGRLLVYYFAQTLLLLLENRLGWAELEKSYSARSTPAAKDILTFFVFLQVSKVLDSSCGIGLLCNAFHVVKGG